jgi:hypothetical protein
MAGSAMYAQIEQHQAWREILVAKGNKAQPKEVK